MTQVHVLLGLLLSQLLTAHTQTAFAQSDQPELANFLEMYGVTPAALSSADLDANPIAPVTISALEAIHRIPMLKQAQWSKSELVPHEIAMAPDGWRARLLFVRGRLRELRPVNLDAADAARLGVAKLYACRVDWDDEPPIPTWIYTLGVPDRLQGGDKRNQPVERPWDERVHARAILLGPTAEPGAQGLVTLLLAAERLAWYPDRKNPSLGVDDKLVWLASQGVDVSRLETVRDNAPLQAGDTEAFFQLLASAHRWDASRLKSAPQTALDVPQLLQDPAPHRGQLVTFRGSARRAVPILVEEPNITERLGVSQYFEVEVFVEPEIPIVIRTGESERRFNRYPIVVCCRSLPEGMPQGETIHEPVEFTAVMFKTWAYPSAWLRQETQQNNSMQVSPLLIAKSPRWLAGDTPPLSFLERFGGWLFVLAIALIAAVVSWTKRGDRHARQRMRKRFESSELIFPDEE